MDYSALTKEQLIEELQKANELISQLKKSEELLKQAEATLKEEAIRRRILIDESRDGIVILDENGKVYEANKKYAEMLGYSMEEIYNLHVWDWDAQIPKEFIKEMAKNVDEKGHHFETKHRRKDGSIYDVEISTNGAYINGHKFIFCVCRDITERKRNEERLREREAQLSAFIDNFRGIAYALHLDEIDNFKPHFFKGAIYNISGFPAEIFQNSKSWNDIVCKDDIDRLKELRRRFKRYPNYLLDIEYRIIRSDGEIRWVNETAHVVKINDKDIIYGVIFDITQRKLAEESKVKLEQQLFHSQKLEAIGTLAGGIAHDFNNILWIISGYADLALRELPKDSSVYAKLIEIRKAGDRAKEIVKQLLTFSRKMEPKKIPVDVRYIIVEVLSFLRSSLPSTIELHSDIKLEGEMIMGDATQLHQVIMNLCVNASQVMENKGGNIWVKADTFIVDNESEECFRQLPRGTYVRIIVEDNGPGIPPEIMDRIFEPYFTTREVGKGSGMGLAVVHGIVKNHGGLIVVKSEVGKGTIFTLLFPTIGKRECVEGKETIDIEDIPTGKECVLFVDDEEAIVAIAKMILEELGYIVTAVKDPFDAVELFSYSPHLYNLVITDMVMPGMSGVELFKELKRIRNDVPVILCTGHSDRIDEKKALELGLNAYVMKPLSRMELACVIRKVLDNQVVLDSSET